MIMNIRTFLRKWSYCSGCMYLKAFKCSKYNKGMIYGCCGHKREIKTTIIRRLKKKYQKQLNQFHDFYFGVNNDTKR